MFIEQFVNVCIIFKTTKDLEWGGKYRRILVTPMANFDSNRKTKFRNGFNALNQIRKMHNEDVIHSYSRLCT